MHDTGTFHAWMQAGAVDMKCFVRCFGNLRMNSSVVIFTEEGICRLPKHPMKHFMTKFQHEFP